MRVYDEALEQTTSTHAPWHVIPADAPWPRGRPLAGSCSRSSAPSTQASQRHQRRSARSSTWLEAASRPRTTARPSFTAGRTVTADERRKNPRSRDTDIAMDAESSDRSRLLDSVSSSDGESAAQILAACPTVDIVAGEPYFGSSLPAGPLLVVERGFVHMRVAPPRANRSIITCDAGLGGVVLPPASEEVLFALVDSKLTVISPEALDALLALPGMAKTLLEQLALTLGQKGRKRSGTSGAHDTSSACAKALAARAQLRACRAGRCADRLPPQPHSARRHGRLVARSRDSVARRAPARWLRRSAGAQLPATRLARLRRVGNPALAGRAAADVANCDSDHRVRRSRILGSSGSVTERRVPGPDRTSAE